MEIRPDQLAGTLRKQLPDLIWISGDEPLLVQDCVQEVRKAAAAVTGGSRERFSVETGFDWPVFAQACAESSLFSPRTLIELHLPEPKPGKAGAEVLRQVAGLPAGGNLILIISGKLARETRNSAWAKALLKRGALVPVWPLRASDLPGWIVRELKQHGLQADREAIQMLVDCTEGNLLATRQEIQKLALQLDGGTVTAEQLREVLADQTRYSVFELVDHSLAGRPERALHCLHTLRETGTEAIQVLWALAREIRMLRRIRLQTDRGNRIAAALQQERVWQNRQALVTQAAKRLSGPQLDQLLLHAGRADRAIKGGDHTPPWQILEELTLTFAGRPLRPGSLSA